MSCSYEQPTSDDDSQVTLQSSELLLVGQIVIDFERGSAGKDSGRPYRPPVNQSSLGVASERGKK